MYRFLYRAKKGPDEVLEDVIEADSEDVAVNKLIQSGLYPIYIKEEDSGHGAQAVLRSIKAKDIANFTRQLSELLSSGLTLYNALGVIENQIENQHLKMIISDIKGRIKEGKAFSEALKNYPGIFSALYTNLVHSGEESSSLNEVLGNIADALDKDEDMRAKIIAALTYPSLMAIVGFLTIFILMAFVVPRLVNMFVEMGDELPLLTRLLIGVSDFLRAYWFLLTIFIIGAIFLFERSKSNLNTKNKMDRLKLKAPVFGNLIRDTELARFSRTLSMLLKNGVPILDSLRITAGVITNSAIKREVEAVYDEVKAGSSLTLAIKKKTSFPLFMMSMTLAGEEGGFLDRALLNIARSYETEIDRLMKIITSLLEPVFILIMGLVVGFIVVAMLLPVFQISLAAH